jgi:hypothetical protein
MGLLPALGLPSQGADGARPGIIRWGADASSDVLRQRTRCSKCGNRGGVTIQGPGWGSPHIRFARFPVEYL